MNINTDPHKSLKVVYMFFKDNNLPWESRLLRISIAFTVLGLGSAFVFCLYRYGLSL